MNNLDRYLKIAKKVLIKPGNEDIEDKIIKRLSNVGEDDKRLLDENFMDYLRKSNSRLYLFSENIKNNPGKYAMLAIFSIAFIGVAAFIIKSFYCKSLKTKNSINLKNTSRELSPSKNKN